MGDVMGSLVEYLEEYVGWSRVWDLSSILGMSVRVFFAAFFWTYLLGSISSWDR